MIHRLKIIHWILFLWLLILILRFELIVDYILLYLDYIIFFLRDSDGAISVVNLRFVDSVFSTILFLLGLPLIFLFRNKLNFLNRGINFSLVIITVLCFVFIFTPLISNENPEFSKNLSVTKLKPPLSTIKFIQIKPDNGALMTEAQLYRQRMEELIKPSFNEKIIFADSVKLFSTVKYFQKDNAIEISAEKLFMIDGSPVINERVFLIGTDEYGRDLFVRLIYGTRISVIVGLGAVIISFIIGIFLGFISGYRGGFLDVLLNRFTEIFLAFPVIYLVVLILALFGSSMISVIIVLGVSGWMSLFKIVKSEVLSIKQKDFFLTAELVGLKKSRLLFREILPVITIPVLVNLVFLFSNVVLAEAALSYLGLGIGNTYPSWGSMISSGQEYMTRAWWLIVFPGLGLILTLYSINSSGRALGKMFNPRVKI